MSEKILEVKSDLPTDIQNLMEDPAINAIRAEPRSPGERKIFTPRDTYVEEAESNKGASLSRG